MTLWLLMVFAPPQGWVTQKMSVRALGMVFFPLQVLLEGVHSSCEENRVRECLRKVQEST